MLTRIDRIQLAVPDRAEAARGWVELLGAAHHGDDRVACLGALRGRYRLGTGWVEVLQPDGDGPVADALSRRGRGHLFAAGAATADLEGLIDRLRRRGVEPVQEGHQVHLSEADSGGHGLRLVVSRDDPGERAGLLGHFYEVTNLVHDAPTAVSHYAELFGLDPSQFQPIASEAYGYTGTLTLFAPGHLDRLEVITPTVADNTMGRFFSKAGESLYMAFAEAPDLVALEERLMAAGAGFTAEPRGPARDERGPHTIFIHPAALGGMMLGLSRPTYAWRWSGHPERVEGGV